MVESARLESVLLRKRYEGSNPSLSAIINTSSLPVDFNNKCRKGFEAKLRRPNREEKADKTADSNLAAQERGLRPSVWAIPSASSSFVVRYQSGQMDQTVNLTAQAFGGSNPPLTTN